MCVCVCVYQNGMRLIQTLIYTYVWAISFSQMGKIKTTTTKKKKTVFTYLYIPTMTYLGIYYESKIWNYTRYDWSLSRTLSPPCLSLNVIFCFLLHKSKNINPMYPKAHLHFFFFFFFFYTILSTKPQLGLWVQFSLCAPLLWPCARLIQA